MGYQEVSAPNGWKAVGKIYDTDDPELLDSTMVEVTKVGTNILIYIGWEPEEDPAGHYVVGALRGSDSAIEPISIPTLTQTTTVLESLCHWFDQSDDSGEVHAVPPVSNLQSSE